MRSVAQGLVRKFKEPAFLFMLLLVTLSFQRIPAFEFHAVTIRIPLIIGVGLIGLYLRQIRSFFPKNNSEKLLYAFLLTLVLVLAASLNPRHSAKILVFIVFCVALSFAVARTSTSLKWPKITEWLYLGAFVTIVVAFYQFFADLLGVPTYLTGLRPDYTKLVFGFPRIQAGALEPLFFVNFLLLPLAFLTVDYIRGRVRARWLILVYCAIFLTVSRGGIIAALIIAMAGCIWAFVQRRPSRITGIVAIVVVGALSAYTLISVVTPAATRLQALLRPLKAEQVTKAHDAANTFKNHATNLELGQNQTDRARTRQAAIEIFKQHPLFGVGLGNFGVYAHKINPLVGATEVANNLPLELLAENGLLSTLAFIVFIATLFVQTALVALKKTIAVEQRSVAAALCIWAVGTGVQYQTFSTLYIEHIWVGLGLMLCVNNMKKKLAASTHL